MLPGNAYATVVFVGRDRSRCFAFSNFQYHSQVGLIDKYSSFLASLCFLTWSGYLLESSKIEMQATSIKSALIRSTSSGATGRIIQPSEEAMRRFKQGRKGPRPRSLAQWSHSPIVPAVMGFQFQNPTRQVRIVTLIPISHPQSVMCSCHGHGPFQTE